MAIAHTSKLSEGLTTNGATFTTTGTLTTVANALYIAVCSWSGTTNRTFTSLVHNAGTNPLTFVKMADVNFNTIATPLWRTVNCRGMKTGASTAGTLTLTLSGSASRACILVSEFTGTDTSGTDGSGAVLQTTLTNSTNSAATLNLVFAALGNSNNRMHVGACSSVAAGATFTPDGSYTEIADQIPNAPGPNETGSTETQWDNGTGDLTCTVTPSGTAAIGIVGVEIKASTGSVATDTDTGTATEALPAIVAAVVTVETGTESDVAALVAILTTAEAATLTESATASLTQNVVSSDSLTLSEIAGLAVGVGGVESSALAEASSLTVQLTNGDAGTLTEGPGASLTVTGVDSSTLAEAGVLTAGVGSSDSATESESESASQAASGSAIADTESATVLDSAQSAAQVGDLDAHGLTDAQIVEALLATLESVAFIDDAIAALGLPPSTFHGAPCIDDVGIAPQMETNWALEDRVVTDWALQTRLDSGFSLDERVTATEDIAERLTARRKIGCQEPP